MSLFRIGEEAASPVTSEPRPRRGPREEPKRTDAIADALSRLAKWIPAETLALYAPGVTVLSADSPDPAPSLAFLIAMIVVTPLFTIGAVFATGGKVTESVVTSAGLATGAFVIWSFSVPLNGWQEIAAVADNQTAFALGAAVIAILYAFFAEGVWLRQRRRKAAPKVARPNRDR